MQMTEDLIRSVVQQVLSQMGNGDAPTNGAARARPSGTFGVYPTADAAVRRPRRPSSRSDAGRSTTAGRPSSCIRNDLRRAGRGARPDGARGDEDRPARPQDRQAPDVILEQVPGVEYLRTENVSRRRRPDAHRVRPVRRHRRDHAGDAQPADAGRQRDQHARGGQHGGRQPPPVGGEDRRRGRPPVQQGDPRGDRASTT